MDPDGDRRVLPDDGRPDRDSPTRGLHRFQSESLEELAADLLTDILEGLELRLAFEAWADARE